MRRTILWLVISAPMCRAPMAAQLAAAPAAPTPQISSFTVQAQAAAQGSTSSAAPQLPAAGLPQRLTLQDAEAQALRNNPQISVARLLLLASGQVTREQRSAYFPNVTASLTAVDAQQGSRLAAGALNNPALLTRAAGGMAISQLITDFGRTANLVAAAALRARAADMNAAATSAQIRLAVEEAFFGALQSRAEQMVAEQTVKARQLVSDQITTLFQNKLRSELDVSFANANLAQARLLLLDAQNNYQAALSRLSEVMGSVGQQPIDPVEPQAEPNAPPSSTAELEQQAFHNRPEIAAQSYEYQAERRFQNAERDLLLPTISALGVAGQAAAGSSLNAVPQFPTWYGAAGVNLNLPVFNGFQNVARWREAGFRAQAANEQLRDVKDRIANEVRTSWLNAVTAYNRIAVSRQFLEQSNLALNLSQARYDLGLSSIVELSQAQLQQTQAQIQFAAATYQYRIAEAVLRFQAAAP
ncbi:MAG: TolC family protein [Acidobacteria bacterium]|nr:TolC family protein [Acidobacteriota bacterium]